MRKHRQLLVFLVILALFAGCGSTGTTSETTAMPGGDSAPAAADRDSVIVVMNTESEPESGFDPAYGWGAGEHVHEPLIQSTLTVTTQDLQIGYDLATGLEVSADGLTWTVPIRTDAVFTDGEPLTAADVAFTYNTVKEQSTVNDFTMLDRAEAVDDATVVFHMNRPYSIWPYSMAHVGIVPAHVYGPGYGEAPVGSGRYILRQWDKGQQVILEANPGYYGKAPALKTVVILFMSEDAAFAAVQAGQVDLAYTAASWSGQAVAGYRLLAAESVDNRGLNLPAIPFDGMRGSDVTGDPAVRRAINIGIDRQVLIDNVLDGHGSPAYSVCDKLPWYSADSRVNHDPDSAAALLDEAGWIPAEDGIRVKDGVRAEVNILYPASDSVRQAIAAESANQLKGLGIHASFEGVGWDVAYDRAQTEIMTWGWGAHTPMELYNIYHTAEDGLAAYSPYRNPAVDDYMDRALATGDLAEANRLWQQAQWDGETGIAADVPWVWLCNIDHLYWQRDSLQVAEQKIHPHGHGWSIVNNVDQWSWE